MGAAVGVGGAVLDFAGGPADGVFGVRKRIAGLVVNQHELFVEPLLPVAATAAAR